MRMSTTRRDMSVSALVPGSERLTRICLSSSKCCAIELASYADPANDVVTKAGPGSFHRGFYFSAASKLAESTSLFDPGVREFGDLRSLAVDCFCLFALHFGFESRGCRRILAASDGPSPFGALLLGAALITQRTATACCFRCSVDLQAHTMLVGLHNMKSKSFASGTNVDVVLSVVRKLATNKLSTAPVGVILGWFPAIMP